MAAVIFILRPMSTELDENRFCLNSIADKVLDVVGEKTVVEKPFVARVLAAVTEAFTSLGETVTYPTLLGAMIATLETKDAERQGASNQSPVTVCVGLRTTRCVWMICAALCDCLTVVVSRVPRAVLVLQAPRLMSIHRTLLERHSKNLSIQKSVMSSLSKVVPCLDRSSANSVRVLLGVLIPTMVHRRKRRLAFGRTHCRRCFEDGFSLRTQERDVPSGRGDGVEGRRGAAQGGRHGVGGDGFEDPFQEAGRSGCGSSVSDTVSLCGDDADAAGGWLLRAVHLASASEGLDDPASSDICHGVWRPQSCLRSKQRRPAGTGSGGRDSPRFATARRGDSHGQSRTLFGFRRNRRRWSRASSRSRPHSVSGGIVVHLAVSLEAGKIHDGPREESERTAALPSTAVLAL